ncbi:hypothetical protein T11_55 [Trichinella zimbabwensis]|uniref:Uncharacterized protein n=1 Tax=Trichinella zimbabwensis TaxID=268475 RepID=A0A0V1H2B2_9BILA|nr:hypothetical protein T11_55 [Trichinella zimbabwensis]
MKKTLPAIDTSTFSANYQNLLEMHFSRILPSFPDAPAKYWSVEWRRVAGLQLTANLFRSSRNLPN